jgi:hypothetical protein
MIDILRDILPYISGLNTLPWILIGFIITVLIARITGREKIDKIMKKIGLILLYFFVPVLLFRIFLNTTFGKNEIEFAIVTSIVILYTYILAFIFAEYTANKNKLKGSKRNLYIKTTLTNQGRSSAFIGGALLAIEAWKVPAAIFIALVGIALFFIMPFILSHLHKKESKNPEKEGHIKALPWYLKLYPGYLLIFVIAAVTLHATTGATTSTLGDVEPLFLFYTALTIPAALYYVGAGIHPSDLKTTEIKKLIGLDKRNQTSDHWDWVRKMFHLTVIITPIITLLILTPLLILKIIPSAWFAVIIINVFLPITSTNMFLLPYGIDKKSTAHSITWTTLVCVPIVVALITLFELYL